MTPNWQDTCKVLVLYSHGEELAIENLEKHDVSRKNGICLKVNLIWKPYFPGSD